MSAYETIVIGAGMNGLTCAALLAKHGQRVLTLERRGVIGGLAIGDELAPLVRGPGILHDTTCVRRWVAEKLGLHASGLRFAASPPSLLATQAGGRGVLLHHDAARAALELREAGARDAEQYARYRAFLDRIRPVISGALDEPAPDLYQPSFSAALPHLKLALQLRRLGAKDMLEVLRIAPMCVADWLNEWFESQPLKCALAGPALYGSFAGPWSPGTNAFLLFHECTAQGDVVGGPAALASAVEVAARQLGVEVRTQAAVSEILVDKGRVRGVKLADGATLDAARVVSSLDPRQTLLQLTPSRFLPQAIENRLVNFRTSGTTAKLSLVLSAPLSFAGRPNEYFSLVRIAEELDDMERAFDPLKYGDFARKPILEVYCPGPDQTRGAGGVVVASVMASFVAHDLKRGWNQQSRATLENAILDTLEIHAPGVRGLIVASELLTPVDIETRYGVTGGHIYHGDHALDQFMLRPTPELARYRAPIEGLYLCGAGCHPGGGLTLAPGALAAAEILGKPARRL